MDPFKLCDLRVILEKINTKKSFLRIGNKNILSMFALDKLIMKNRSLHTNTNWWWLYRTPMDPTVVM